MGDLSQQWVERARYDLDTADAMFKAGHFLYVLFRCQQAIEKALKAVIVKKTGELPRAYTTFFVSRRLQGSN